MWQEGVLLGAREPMQLINKEKGLLTMFTTLNRCGDGLAHLGNTVAGCGEACGDRL